MNLRDFSELTTRHGVEFLQPQEFLALCRNAFKYDRELHGAHVMKYDSLISGELGPTEDYLGFSLPRLAKVSDHISYNERQKALGIWRDWFTPTDVDDYRSSLSGFIKHFGFDSDWTLSEEPYIAPEYGSGYISKSVAKLTEFPASSSELREARYYTDAYIAHLQSARSDGIESAIIELALAHFVGYGVEKSLDQYRAYLHEAYERGNVTAMIHLFAASHSGIIDLGSGPSESDLANEAVSCTGSNVQASGSSYTGFLRGTGGRVCRPPRVLRHSIPVRIGYESGGGLCASGVRWIDKLAVLLIVIGVRFA